MPYFTQESYRIEIGKILCLEDKPGEDGGFFMKPASSIAHFDQSIVIPEDTEELGYRMQLAAAVGKKIRKNKKHKISCLMGFGAAIDVYDEALLELSKKNRSPWTEAVGSDTFCPISDFTPSKDIEDPYGLEAYMEINGKEVLNTNTRELALDLDSALENITRRVTLYPGDIICIPLDGDPGRLKAGDSIEAGISSIGVMRHIVKDGR